MTLEGLAFAATMFLRWSGFVLTLPFVDRPDRIFRPRELWQFFANRALRIIPAFVVTVLLFAWEFKASWDWIWPNLTFSSGWSYLWSVATEARFYILFPLVLGALSTIRSRAWQAVALLILIVLAWEFQRAHRIDLMDGSSVPFYFFFFVTGMVACLMYRALQSIDLGYSVDVLVPLFVVGIIYFKGWEYPALWCAMFFFLLVGSANSGSALVARLFRSWPMRHIGLLSYGIYLFHIYVVMRLLPLELEGIPLLAATFGASYAAALVSYLLIEKPSLMLKPKRATKTTTAGGVVLTTVTPTVQPFLPTS